MTSRARLACGAILVISLALVGCTDAPPSSREKPSTLIALKLADKLRARDGVRSVDIDWHNDDRYGSPELDVELESDVAATRVTKLADLVSGAERAKGGYVTANFAAGDFTWNVTAGFDEPRVASSVNWLRSDPRVQSAHVYSLEAAAVTAREDVFDTASDFYDAMNRDDRYDWQRLEIASSPQTSGTVEPLEVDVATNTPFPDDAIAAYQTLLGRLPSAGVSISHLEGDNPLKMTVRVDAQTDVVLARDVVAEVVVPLVGDRGTRLQVGLAFGPISGFSDSRIPFARAVAAIPDVTAVGLGRLATVSVASLAAWNAAQDVAVATLAEPATVSWMDRDAKSSLRAVARPATDPLRLVAASLIGVRSVRSVDVQAPGKDLVTLVIVPSATSTVLAAMVQAVVSGGLADTIHLQLQVDTRSGPDAVAKIDGGKATALGQDADGLGADFVTAWNAATGH